MTSRHANPRTLILGVLCSFLLTGCSFALGGVGSTRQFYLLSDSERPQAEQEHPTLPVRLVVRETLASPFIYSQRIIFTRDSLALGEYQSGWWSEPPPRRFTTLLLLRFSDNGNYDTVSREASSTIADVELNTDLIECLVDATSGKHTVRVTVAAELVRTKERRAVTRRTFSAEREITEESLEAAIEGFGAATSQVISEITRWTDSEVASGLARGIIRKSDGQNAPQAPPPLDTGMS